MVMAMWRCSAVPKAAKLCLGLPNASHAMPLAMLSIASCNFSLSTLSLSRHPVQLFYNGLSGSVAATFLFPGDRLPGVSIRYQNLHFTTSSCSFSSFLFLFTPPLHHETSQSSIFQDLWVHLRYDSSHDLRLC